ncbi:hypothetical protein ACOMHN_025413 [Nucella lapillus]
MSHSVASGISTLVQLNALPTQAINTAQFIERLDRVFNCFNSGSEKNAGRQMGHAMSESSGHKEFLLETLECLKSVKSGSSRSLPCLIGWQLAIHTLLGLFEELHTEHGVRFLMTDRLNQDCLENFFSCIRGKGGHLDNPDATQFRLFFRQLMVDKFFLHSPGSSCRDDNDSFLLTLTCVSSKRDNSTARPVGVSENVCDVGMTEIVCDGGMAERMCDISMTEVVCDNMTEVVCDNMTEMVCDNMTEVICDNMTEVICDNMTEVVCESSQYEAFQDLRDIACPPPPEKDALLQLAEQNILVYISGYIAKKLLGKVCNECKPLLTGPLL